MDIYTAEGLRVFALFLDDVIQGEHPKFGSQNELAELAGVPANTIKACRRNRDLAQEAFDKGQFHRPKLEPSCH